MRTTYGSTFLLVCVGVLASGCYATKSVRPDDFRMLGGNLRASASLPTPSEGPAILDAEALVRLNPADGGSTDWIPASSLFVSPDALYVEAGIAASDLAGATVSDLGPEQVERLRTLAPKGGSLARETRPTGETYRLKVAEPSALLPWIGRFASEQRAAQAYEGAWRLEKRKAPWWRGEDPRPFSLSFASFEGPLTGDERLFVARGVPWSKLKSIELNYLDPLSSVLAVPFAPLLLIAGPPDDGREHGKNLFGPTANERQIWRKSESEMQPLFALQGKRRAIVKLVGGIDAGVEYGGSFFSTASVGLRFRNMFEFAFIARELSKAGAPGEPRRGHTLMGGAAGLHIDGDGDPSFAFYIGAEGLGYLGGGHDQVMSLVFGPRFGFRNGLQVTVVPLSATSLCRTDEQGHCVGGPGGIYSSIQLGLSY